MTARSDEPGDRLVDGDEARDEASVSLEEELERARAELSDRLEALGARARDLNQREEDIERASARLMEHEEAAEARAGDVEAIVEREPSLDDRRDEAGDALPSAATSETSGTVDARVLATIEIARLEHELEQANKELTARAEALAARGADVERLNRELADAKRELEARRKWSEGEARRSYGRAVVPSTSPQISVVIPTYDRAALLRESLESLAHQSIAPDVYEVIVVDDGSTDDTREVCLAMSSRIPLVYKRIEPSGVAAAKNAGIRAATGRIIHFFDDDDVAHRDMLREHLRSHEEHPESNVAVLGYTTWAPSLDVSEVMGFVTDVGHHLFSYDGLADGEVLDFTYFWGGRTSCKRSLLESSDLFHPEFRFGCEDIELGYRLSRSGLQVVFNRAAIQYMKRRMTYDEFCGRCERQGRARWLFSQLHDDPVVRNYCLIPGAREKWQLLQSTLFTDVRRIRTLEHDLLTTTRREVEQELRRELHSLYRRTFDAFELQGIIRGADELGSSSDGDAARNGGSQVKRRRTPALRAGASETERERSFTK